MASQRTAHLNTTAISNCHTTFIGSLPRTYDRQTLNEAYAISSEVLDRTKVTFPPDNWDIGSFMKLLWKNFRKILIRMIP
ncbi:MAG: hypothetical protein WBX01_03205 [Nitrososphaeraceae archaeon]